VWTWLIDPSRSSIIGVIGLSVSVVGFALTLWQLLATKKAAQAATEAAENARMRINTFSALRECEAAKRHAKLVNNAIKEAAWMEVIELSQPLIESITSLANSNADFDYDVRQSLSSAVSLIEKNCVIIDRLSSDRPNHLLKAKQFAAFRPVDQALSVAYFKLERNS